MKEFTCSNLSVNEKGRLCFGGQDTKVLAEKYGTPLYLMDEDRIRSNCRSYLSALGKHFASAKALYASKACSFKHMYEIMKEEGMGVDVVSSGEIYTAKKAGFDLSKAYFHSNNKTDFDISFAMENGVGCFVADNKEEVSLIEAEAAKRGTVQKILLRLTPGIDPHTYAAISTGKVDSKFGTAIETGQADEMVAFTLTQKHVELAGFHCHVGSMVFGEDVYERAVAVMLGFAAEMKKKYGYCIKELDMGGGIGVRYTNADPVADISERLSLMAETFHRECRALGLEEPTFIVEPGRSIAADAGLTLYTAGSVKRITGYKNYVSVDGGMTDNPRFALYGSRYTCLAADKMNEPCNFTCSIVGRCCESGDIIQENVSMPESVCRGDLVAVCTTGAYNYSMASNYNRIPRPPIVMLKGGESFVAVRRETLEDLAALDE